MPNGSKKRIFIKFPKMPELPESPEITESPEKVIDDILNFEEEKSVSSSDDKSTLI